MCSPNMPVTTPLLLSRRPLTSNRKRKRPSLSKVRFSPVEETKVVALVETRNEMLESGEAKEVWYNGDELMKINVESLRAASLMKQYICLVSNQSENEVHIEQCCSQLPQDMLEELERSVLGGHASRGIFHLCDENTRRIKKINKVKVVCSVLKQQAALRSNFFDGKEVDSASAISKASRESSRKARASAHLRGIMDQLAARSAEKQETQHRVPENKEVVPVCKRTKGAPKFV